MKRRRYRQTPVPCKKRPRNRINGRFWIALIGQRQGQILLQKRILLHALYATRRILCTFEARGEPIRIVRVVIVRRAVRVHHAEIVAVVVIRGTQPPVHRTVRICPLCFNCLSYIAGIFSCRSPSMREGG